ncbi:hypothetical protein [Streptomyces sp. NPDC053079]|uniref:hypothetical protein n=1 Tax=Streptomyces sp. NPDC053079 TaxID=3365697 RepID=UPI0037CF4AE5
MTAGAPWSLPGAEEAGDSARPARSSPLIKDPDGVTHRARNLHTDIDAAGLPFLHQFIELALAFHYAVRNEDQDPAATIDRLRVLTATGDFAHFTDIAHYMAGLRLPGPTATHWIDSPEAVRTRWQHLVHARRTHSDR